MNSHIRADQSLLMDNYRRFASKYNGEKPKLDPLVKKHVYKQGEDVSPGRVVQSVSKVSLGGISVDYNEGSALARRNESMKRGNHLGSKNTHFMRKSQSINGVLSKSGKKAKTL